MHCVTLCRFYLDHFRRFECVWLLLFCRLAPARRDSAMSELASLSFALCSQYVKAGEMEWLVSRRNRLVRYAQHTLLL